ncbi:MAG: DUF2148 domain-containing protein [Thermodesulfobacteriota bacterium]
MARINGRDAAREAVLEAAKLAAAAAYKAPQLTSQLNLRTEIVTGEDQAPIIEFYGEIAPISPVMYFDYETIRHFLDKGETIALLLLGADLTFSELGWDCGACGFATCAEFNKYAKANKSPGLLWSGPSCQWKLMDWAAACDFACAALSQIRVDNRAMATCGAAAAATGFLPDCSALLGIPIGPPGENIYYSRAQNMPAFPYEQHRQCLLRTAPTNWMAFAGSTKPALKTRDDWWNNMEYVKWEPLAPEELQAVQAVLGKVQAVAQKHYLQVSSWYKKDK